MINKTTADVPQHATPKISIITACLNAGRTLEQAIKSVLDQNYPNLEYIIIDGGSSDGTLDIIKKYEDKLARVVSEPDNGIYDAFNKGIRLASGDVIGILNADDYYAPRALETVARTYEANPECDVYYGKVAVIDETDKSWKVYSIGDISGLTYRMSISHPAVFLPKLTYDKWGVFDIGYRIAGDWDYLLRIFMNGAAFMPVEAVLTAFRFSGVSSFLSRRHLAENCKVYKRHLRKRVAWCRIIRMYAKYFARCVLKATRAYGIYAGIRDKTIFVVELSGDYSGDATPMWDVICERSVATE